MKKTAVGLVSLALLAACGSGTSDEQAVTILTHDSFVMSEEQIAAFEEKSGFTLQTIAPGDGGVLVNQLILNRDNPQADGVYGIDTFIARTVIEEGLLAPYSSPALPESANDLVVADSLTPIDQGDVCVNVDTAWFEAEGMAQPETFEDLREPEYAELLAVIDPASSSPGYAFLVATATEYGEDWQGYWADLLDGGARVASGWSDAYYSDFSGADGKGPYPLVLSYSSSPAAAAGTDYLPETCVRQVEYAGVVKDAANPEGAQAFVDFMLSDEFQSSIPENMYMYPVTDQELPAQWQEVAELSETPIMVDPQQVDRDELLDAFAELR
ncbi:thiamine ABC transporter substrate-binding protein [Flaviflexus huanghaiensis]|uniref:thiamine ABC transporter substrate-binding protein n=1 Tax=Flaviflexus huanghaiensis TaxID=1111473 RepID=UPI0015FC2BEB|nr:thiamine ABC transporter substrate-binding protein [Flaviflexus huanghaiensis]